MVYDRSVETKEGFHMSFINFIYKGTERICWCEEDLQGDITGTVGNGYTSKHLPTYIKQ